MKEWSVDVWLYLVSIVMIYTTGKIHELSYTLRIRSDGT